MDDFTFDFEKQLEAQQPAGSNAPAGAVNIGPGGRAEPKPRNYRQVRLALSLVSPHSPL